ncbi:hypothetical protein [Streptomyces sp. H27-C3]|uniref:hypothetical protein n=1 Tax=Streptomyces sp. H27-C3 TaxID=3046305 RepID=UPI0024B9A3CE|nr:hypothetical protein [Streptomyces sp. H27-C3]MDJ0466216.1 hypothetical protein [Streptomyces sp. H27-C3]
MKKHRMQLAVAAGLSALALFGAACTPDDGTKDSDTSKSQDAGAKEAKQTDCLRSKGMKIQKGEDGQKDAISPGDLSPDEMQKALKDCGVQDTSGGAGAGDSGGQGISQAEKDKYLAYAKCMRKEGIDMPDPKFVDGQVQSGTMPDQPDRSKYIKADKVCAQKAGF